MQFNFQFTMFAYLFAIFANTDHTKTPISTSAVALIQIQANSTKTDRQNGASCRRSSECASRKCSGIGRLLFKSGKCVPKQGIEAGQECSRSSQCAGQLKCSGFGRLLFGQSKGFGRCMLQSKDQVLVEDIVENINSEEQCTRFLEALNFPNVKNPNSNLVPNMAKDKSVDRKPSGRIGWECRYNMYCLKEDGLELIKYDEGSGSNWNIAKCQQKCEEYGEGCVMVDIQSYTSDFDYNQAYCVLYTIENARNWGPDVPEPEKYGCRHHTQWMTCAHNGKSLLI